MILGRLLEIETKYETHYTENKIGLTFLAHYIVFDTQSQFGGVILLSAMPVFSCQGDKKNKTKDELKMYLY